MRSTHTPAGRDSTRYGSSATAPSSPISAGEACRYTTAVSGSATVVTLDPSVEIELPTKSLRKSGYRARTANGDEPPRSTHFSLPRELDRKNANALPPFRGAGREQRRLLLPGRSPRQVPRMPRRRPET